MSETYTKEQIEEGVRIASSHFADKLGVSLADFASQCDVPKERLEGFYHGLSKLNDGEFIRLAGLLKSLADAEEEDGA